MIKIIKYDNLCQILNEDDDTRRKALDFHLSYKIQGAEHSKAFKGYINQRGEEVTWDGRKHLLKSNLKFPVGLLQRVCEFYDARNVEYDLDDQRRLVTDKNPIDLLPILKEGGKIPRDYQMKAVENAASVNRGIIRIATGGGKTIVAALLTAALGKPTMIYVIGKDLLYQIHGLFSSLFDEPIGIIGDGKCEIHRINVATIWSVGKSLGIKDSTTDEDSTKEKDISKDKFREIKTMLLDSRVHILDECHLAACETVQAISHHVKAEHFYGMSASPWRDDGSDMLIESVLGRKVVDISAKYLVEKGFLVKPAIRFLAVPPYTGAKKAAYKTVYKNYITVNAARNNMICTAAEKLVEQGFKTLVLFKTKAHGQRLHEIISKKVSCDILDGDDKFEVRKEVCDKLNNGDIDCIIASTIFDIGVDLPSLSALVIGGGGKSSVRALQRVGRVIRKHPGKTIAPVIDFADQAPYLLKHSLMRKEILEEEFEVEWPQENQGQ